MATKDETKKKVLLTSQNTNKPTIQMQLSAWNASYKGNHKSFIHQHFLEEAQSTITDNYVIMVPSYLVFDNMLMEFLSAMNVTSELTVIYDEIYERGLEYDWKRPFENTGLNVKFETTEQGQDQIKAQLKRLQTTSKNLMFVADTMTIEKYAGLGKTQFQSNTFVWMVFTKDTMPFKCYENCTDTQIYWAKVIKTTASEELANFTEFVWSEELDRQFPFSQKTYNHLQTSFCLDVMYTVMRYILGGNNPGGELDANGNAATPMNVTVAALLRNESLDYDFGPYRHHYSHWFYQVTTAVIIRIDRMSRFPKARFSKLIGNWTYIEGLRPKYGGLGVDVRNITHYRVVTILVRPIIIYIFIKILSMLQKAFLARTFCANWRS